MPVWLRTTGLLGSIAVLIAIIIAFIKTLTAFVGFLTFAIQAVIVFAFLALFIGVGLVVFRSWKGKQEHKN